MRFSVCPHDIVKQMSNWLTFAAYLQQGIGESVRLEPVLDFTAFYETDLPAADLAFVNPMDAWRLSREQDFVPLFRTEVYDEAVFITKTERS